MLLGSIQNPNTFEPLLNHPIWKEVITWLQNAQNNPPEDGDYELRGQDMHAIVQTVETQPQSERLFEAHKHAIDVQTCLEGDERVEWAPLNTLTAETDYAEERDLTKYKQPKHTTSMHITPKTFAVFFPEDGHMPKVQGESTTTKKVVIKINCDLLKT